MNQSLFEQKIERIRSGEASELSSLFGFDFSEDESSLILRSIAWDGTCSYHKGAAKGPETIREHSSQLDFCDLDFGEAYCEGIFESELNLPRNLEIPDMGEVICSMVKEDAKKIYGQGRSMGIIGGEHSVPLGLIQALDGIYDEFSILHIDAHHDLRQCYEGYKHSHASIMWNVLESCPRVKKIVSIGIRDFSRQEYTRAQDDPRVQTFYDRDIQDDLFHGRKFSDIVEEIKAHFDEKLYVSFDIDGLSPDLCPNTGTPVPGGLSFAQAVHLLAAFKNHTILGFDLCEVAPGVNDHGWNANVGARMLYKLCGLLLHGNR
jgi:agmatinase